MSSAPTYEELVFGLANFTKQLPDHEQKLDDGRVKVRSFYHFDENGLGSVPDMLTRLGLMCPIDQGHAFTVAPDDDGSWPLIRHRGEPSLDDLLQGLEFYIDWFEPTAMRGKIRGYDHLIGLAVASKRGIIIDGQYVPEDELRAPAIGLYDISRSEAVDRLGSQEALYPSPDYWQHDGTGWMKVNRLDQQPDIKSQNAEGKGK